MAEGICMFGCIAVFPCRKKGWWEIGISSKCKSMSSRSCGRWSSVRGTAVSWVTSAGILCRGSSSLQMNWVYLILRIYSAYCSVERCFACLIVDGASTYRLLFIKAFLLRNFSCWHFILRLDSFCGGCSHCWSNSLRGRLGSSWTQLRHSTLWVQL